MPPRVHHFIVRPEQVKRHPTGLVVEQPLVPLVPLDELPDWLQLVGVPRTLAPEQTTGLSNLGCFERQGVHDVEIVIDNESGSDTSAEDEPQPATAAAAADGGNSNAGVGRKSKTQPGLASSRWADAVNDNGLPGKPDAAPVPTQAAMHPADRMLGHMSPATSPAPGHTAQANQQTAIASPAASTTKPPTTQGITSPSPPGTTTSGAKQQQQQQHTVPPPPTTSDAASSAKKRTYCRHWVHHGTCKWGPYCRFAHAMPATAAGLADVGLREFPAWWTAAVVGGLASSGPSSSRRSGSSARKAARMVGGGGIPGFGYGYGYLHGAGGFFPGYGPGPGPGGLGYGGIAAGAYARREREREVHPYEREKGRVSRVKAEAAGVGGVTAGAKSLEVAERQGGGGLTGLVAAQVAPGAHGAVVVRGEEKRREGQQAVRQEVQQQKLVDV